MNEAAPDSPTGDPATDLPWWVGPLGFLARGLVRLLGATWRVRIVAGNEVLERLEMARREGEPQPVVVVVWHERAVVSVPFLLRLHRRGPRLALLASRSRDGALAARIVAPWQVETVRGSSSRGGRAALRALHRAILRRGLSPVIVPDGPRGPARRFKTGAMFLARQTGAPILPVAVAPRRAQRLRSWDRLMLPWPFTRIAIALGEPETVPRELDAEAFEDERQRLEGVLNELTARADAAVGREPWSEPGAC